MFCNFRSNLFIDIGGFTKNSGLYMKKIKSSSALLIVLFAQANIFAYNYFALKNSAEIKLEKDNKKMVTMPLGKQTLARMDNNTKLITQKTLQENFDKLQQFFVQSFNFVNLKILTSQNYSKFRLLWFGCCKN